MAKAKQKFLMKRDMPRNFPNLMLSEEEARRFLHLILKSKPAPVIEKTKKPDLECTIATKTGDNYICCTVGIRLKGVVKIQDNEISDKIGTDFKDDIMKLVASKVAQFFWPGEAQLTDWYPGLSDLYKVRQKRKK